MADEQFNWEFERSVPSDLGQGRDATDVLLARLQHDGWSENDRYAVGLALEEALVNAVVHGNQCDPDKQVGLHFWLSRRRVRIEVSDQGDGFDPDTLPDPTGPSRLMCPGGRGVMLMRHFMTSIEFADNGRRVVMEKIRSEPIRPS